MRPQPSVTLGRYRRIHGSNNRGQYVKSLSEGIGITTVRNHRRLGGIVQRTDEFGDRQLYVAMHPLRREILINLNEGKTYANKLAEQLKESPKIVQFHLSVLEKYSLVEGNFGLETPAEGRPVAVRYYTLTKDAKDLMDFVRRAKRPA
jgi:DNA-binding transcriptional ArsR family regulator